ncbi:MAG: tetratricopeptide repeat protein, partial [Thermoanaerobaculia bacterium]
RLRQAAKLQGDDPETRFALATALTHLGDYGAAAEQWLELVRLQPRRADGWINLAVTLGRSGRGGEAIGALTRAVELAPGRADLRLQLALAHRAAGDLEAAKIALLGALAVAPELRPRIEADPGLAALLRSEPNP